jgi:peroxiredoxin
MLNRRLFQIAVAFGLMALTNAAMAAGSDTKNSKGVASSADNVKPLAVGKSLPDVTVKTVDGTSVTLLDALDGHASVIVFYRGHWCPFCMKHLKNLQKITGQLKEQGVKLVAITPDTPSHIAKTLKKGNFTMEIYSDAMLNAAKAMGVAFQLDKKIAKRYRSTLMDSSGHDTGQLPVPSVFLIDKAGKITYVFSNPDYKVRLSNDELLAAIKDTLGS